MAKFPTQSDTAIVAVAAIVMICAPTLTGACSTEPVDTLSDDRDAGRGSPDPSEIPKSGAQTEVIVELAVGQQTPAAVAVHGTSVYWFNLGTRALTSTKVNQPWTGSAIKTCPLSHCSQGSTTLAEGLTASVPHVPVSLEVEGQKVYWVDNSGFAVCDAADCRPKVLADVRTEALRVNASQALWTNANTIESCALPGCQERTLVWSGQGDANALAIDAETAYWGTSNPAQLMDCKVDACGSAAILSGPHTPNQHFGMIRALEADGNYLFILDGNGALYRCLKDSCDTTLSLLASGLEAPIDVASDGTNVYWTEQGIGGEAVSHGGSIRKCNVAGCGAEPTSVVTGLARPTDIEVDDRNVYWVESGQGPDDGRVAMTAK